ncbi:Cyanovirin-N [Mycena sanguinolenta]|uniref:Cyanovirin-N n=1 Tax=Mycena sanguinolenta TaxID=230812 RepID=A0A8H6Z026_9AGAR|nr:Cyanovirin-N [Mycena sanguinolenta]
MNALLSSVLFVLCAMTALTEAGDFEATCTFIDVRLDLFAVTAECQDHNGDFGPNMEKNLDLCVGNVNGSLVPGTNFNQTCSNITNPDFLIIAADCITPSGTTMESSINLNDAITNVDGVLTCP